MRYEWAVTEEPSTSNPVYEIIGTEKDFHGIINRPISNGAYTLKLTVTDVAMITYNIFILGNYMYKVAF